MLMMTASTAGISRIAAMLVATLLLGLPAVWAALALWYQAPGGRLKGVIVLLWGAFALGVLIALWQGRAELALVSFALAFAVLLIWWRRITPTNERLWADDVAQITNGNTDGNRVTLRNVRNFDWRSNSEYTQRWETRSYDLDKLTSVDMIMSYWDGWAIAHMLISFGFDDGRHIAFSVEVRRRKNATYSELGGFFKRDGLSIIAADERDVIRVRTNIRGEDDYLFRIRMPLPAMRSLFRGYVEQADRLVCSEPGRARGGPPPPPHAALLQHPYRQLHHAGLSHDEANRGLSALELSLAVHRLSARICLPRRRPGSAFQPRGAARDGPDHGSRQTGGSQRYLFSRHSQRHSRN
jgi:hypothetical protein